MNENLRRAYELLIKSFDLDEGEELIATCEESVREADLAGDLEIQYKAREELVRACVFGGAPDKALLNFSWLLAQFDKNPGLFSEWGILWKYKWIIGLIQEFPQVSKAKIYEMLDDFEARAVRAGYGLYVSYYLRYRVEKFWDNRESALDYYRRMEALPQNDLSNCAACYMDERASLAIYRGDDDRAVEIAVQLLAEKKKCSTVPHRTYANILLPLVRLGRQREALLYHRIGYELIRHNKNFLDKMAEHLIFLVLTENLDAALSLFQNHFQWTQASRDLFNQFRFYRAAWLLFDSLAERRVTPINLQLSESFPLHSASGDYDARSLADWFEQRAREIAARFDARNETDFFSRTLNETPALKKFSQPFLL